MHVEDQGQLYYGVGFFFQLSIRGFQEPNSGHQVCTVSAYSGSATLLAPVLMIF